MSIVTPAFHLLVHCTAAEQANMNALQKDSFRYGYIWFHALPT
jgi:hypothetical protein